MSYYRPFQPPLSVLRPEEVDTMFPYRVTINEVKRIDAYEWVNINAKDDWSTNWVHSKYLKTTVVPQKYQFLFKSRQDALICKLKWG